MYKSIIRKSHVGTNNKDLYEAIINAHKEHHESVDILKTKLRSLKKKIPVVFHCRGDKRMPKIKKDHIFIALGGDGTFIFASHYVKDALMIGINSAPDYSIGHYCKYSLFDKTVDLTRELEDILHDKAAITDLYRLRLKINGAEVPIPIINDLLIVDKNPATTTRYILNFNDKKYHQKSSGIWISTAMGSTAAYASSGGEVFSQYNSQGQKQFGFIIREVYRPEKNTLLKGMVTENDKLEIVISMIEGYIYIDGGQKKIKIHIGDKIELGFQDVPLRAIIK